MTLYNLLEVCCLVTGQDIERVKKKARFRDLVFTRHLFYYMARHYFGAKLREIQGLLYVHHTTILHGLKLVDDLIYIEDPKTSQYIKDIHDLVSSKYQVDKKYTIYVPFQIDAGAIAEMLQLKYGCRVIAENA